MGHREHLDEVPAHLIHHIVRESDDEEAASGRPPLCTGRWMSEDHVGRALDGQQKAVPETGNRRIVVLRSGDKLVARLGMELESHRRNRRSTSAKTSAAGMPTTRPARQLHRAPINLLVPEGVGVGINTLEARQEEFGEPRPIGRGQRE